MPMNYGEAKFTENCGSPSIECFVNPVSMFFFYQKKKKGEKDEEKKKKRKGKRRERMPANNAPLASYLGMNSFWCKDQRNQSA